MESVDRIRRYIVDSGGVSLTFAENIAALLREVEREHVDDKRKAVNKAHADGEKSGLKQACSASEDYRRGRKDALDEIAETHMELPKDADGKPIHIGDRMQWPDGGSFDVIGVSGNTIFYVDDDFSKHAEWTRASDKRHYESPTVEKVLWHLAQEARAYEGGDFDADMADLVAEYADKLQIKGERDG